MNYDDEIEKTRIQDFGTLNLDGDRQDALVQIYPPGQNMGKKWELGQDDVFIGRSRECRICIDNNAISRNHARLSSREEGRVLEDLGSTNGTFVNNVQITSHIMQQGDQVKVGDAIFKYLIGSDVESAYHEEIYRMTIIDGLTNTYNKRHFMDELVREVTRSSRYGRPLSLIIIDIDHFKKVNDTHGHLAGDAILQGLASRIQERIRKDEIFARYGGEEFGLVLPESELKGAVSLAETLRKLITKKGFNHEGMSIPVTVSMGVASINGEDVSPEEFIKRADEKLYQAKRRGRNKVCS